MAEDNIIQQNAAETDDFDIKAILFRLWEKRKFILIVAGIISAWGLVVAICQKKEYTTECTFVPQFSSAGQAMSLYSFSVIPSYEALESILSGESMSPLVYPQILEDVNFNKELMHTPLHFRKFSEPISLFTYYTDPKYKQFDFVKTVKKYTIDIPSRIIDKLTPEEPEVIVPAGASKQLAHYTKDEANIAKKISSKINMEIDKTEFYYSLSVKFDDPLASAELCQTILDLLEKNIIEFKIAHAQQFLEYIKELHSETEKEYKTRQLALAKYVDANRGAETATTKIRREHLTSEYNLALSAYSEINRQLLEAEVKVREDTPALSNVTSVSIPNKPSNSKIKTLLIWVFVAFFVACSSVLGLDWIKKTINKPSNWD